MVIVHNSWVSIAASVIAFTLIAAQDEPPWLVREGPALIDAEDGDPRNSIICQGGPPKMELMDPYDRQEYDSILSMCADIAYGGFLGMNAGASCLHEFNPPAMVFRDLVLPLEVRRRMFCFQKCWCATNDELLPEDPLLTQEVLRTTASYVWRFTTFSVVNINYPGVTPVGTVSRGQRRVYGLDITTPGMPQMRQSSIGLAPIVRYAVHGEYLDMISCRGEVPDILLPNRAHLPVTLEGLCRAEVLGGEHGLTLGGYCKHIPRGIPTVFFEDEHSGPWDSWGEQMTMYKRLFCYAHCWCDSSRRPWPRSIVPWFHSAHIDDGKNGLVLRWSDDGVESEYMLIEPAGPPQPDQQSVRGSNSEGSRAQLDDFKRFLGEKLPLPSFYPDHKGSISPDILGGPKAKTFPGVCGGACEGVASGCSKAAQGIDDCRCIAQPVGDSSLKKFAGVCLSLAAITVASSSDLLGRRSQLGEGWKQKPEFGCVCNATYISHSCCGTGEDGLVWEEDHHKLGEIVY